MGSDDEQKILGKTPDQWRAERARHARRALEGFEPAAVLQDEQLLEQAARRMHAITWERWAEEENIAWETDAAPKEPYYEAVRAAATELVSEREARSRGPLTRGTAAPE